MRDANRSAQARARCIFRDGPCEVSQANAARECEPRRELELVFREDGFQIPVRLLRLDDIGARTIVGREMNELVVVLSEAVESDARVVRGADGAQCDLRARISGSQMLRGAYRRIVRIAIVVRAIEMEEWGIGE